MIRVLVLGAAAGGGFPQWNSNSLACQRARSADPNALPATQASIAVTADDTRWCVVNAAPDLREQINRQTQLHPKTGLRSSPIAAILLTNADVDAVAGLLHLRERTPFTLYGHSRVLGVLDQNPIFRVLAPDVVRREGFTVGQSVEICDPAGVDMGLRITPFAVPGKVALFMESPDADTNFGTEQGDTLGLDIVNADADLRVLYIANCAEVTEELVARCQGADVIFFDGTLWRDDEMIACGEGKKTGRRMGHVSMSGPGGAIESFSRLVGPRKIFIHINNTNPALLSDSDERGQLEQTGWEVAYDGMEIVLQ